MGLCSSAEDIEKSTQGPQQGKQGVSQSAQGGAPRSAQPQSAQPQSAQPQSAQPQSAQPQSAQPQSAQPQSAQGGAQGRQGMPQNQGGVPQTAQGKQGVPQSAQGGAPQSAQGKQGYVPLEAKSEGRNKEPIFSIQANVSNMRHAANATNYLLPVKAGASLSRPTVHPDERHFVIGAHYESGGGVLMLFDTPTKMQSTPVSQCPTEKGIISSEWVGGDRLVVVSCKTQEDAPTTMSMYRVGVEGKGNFEPQASMDIPAIIREVAVNQKQSNLAICGGSSLQLCDFSRLQPVKTFRPSADVSSVRWMHNGSLVSATNVNCKFQLFDLNAGEAVFTYQGDLTKHKALYAHCQTSETQIILGYEDSYIEAIDIRTGRSMADASDPFCHIIGDMCYRESSGYLLLTGLNDFSVYKQNLSLETDKNVARLWCHSTANGNSHKSDVPTPFHGAFLKDNLVVCTHDTVFGVYHLS